MSAAPDQIATLVTTRAVRVGKEDAFEAWTHRLQQLAREAPGYRAALRLGQTAGFQHLLFRFNSRADLDGWQASQAYREHLAAGDAVSKGRQQVATGDAAHFALPSDASASKWKRFVSTWFAVFPVLLAVSSAIRAVLGGLPQVVQLVISSLLLTAALQWLILPRLQRWTRTWVLGDAKGKLRN